jgi:hypothetical protein
MRFRRRRSTGSTPRSRAACSTRRSVVGRLLASGAAIGTDRRGVGQHQPDLHVDQRNVIHQRKPVGCVAYGDMGPMARAISADAIENCCPDGEELATCIKGECGVDDSVPCMIVGEKMLRTRSGPLHRPSEHPRRMEHGDVFRIRLLFASECSSDIGGPPSSLRRTGLEMCVMAPGTTTR